MSGGAGVGKRLLVALVSVAGLAGCGHTKFSSSDPLHPLPTTPGPSDLTELPQPVTFTVAGSPAHMSGKRHEPAIKAATVFVSGFLSPDSPFKADHPWLPEELPTTPGIVGDLTLPFTGTLSYPVTYVYVDVGYPKAVPDGQWGYGATSCEIRAAGRIVASSHHEWDARYPEILGAACIVKLQNGKMVGISNNNVKRWPGSR